MTIKEAIEQMDWYMEEDDGSACDYKTRQAYSIIKTAVENYLSGQQTARGGEVE